MRRASLSVECRTHTKTHRTWKSRVVYVVKKYLRARNLRQQILVGWAKPYAHHAAAHCVRASPLGVGVCAAMGKKKSGGGGSSLPPGLPPPAPVADDATLSSETLDEIEARHASELAAVKAVTASMTAKKDKMTVMRIEGEVTDRHYEEMRRWEELAEARDPTRASAPESSDDDDDAPPVAAMARATVADSADAPKDPDDPKAPSGGMTKAMKRRMKKEAEERERDARIAEEKSNAGPSAGDVEEERLRAALAPLGLKIAQIKADGHCLYRSVAHQLALKPVPGDDRVEGDDHASLRRRCAAVMRADEWDYRPFLPECAESSDAGNAAWAAYLNDLEHTAAWGGQLELGALAKATRRCVEVYSAGMPTIRMGEAFAGDGPSLTVCYQRHAFGLGEHYNSTERA